MPPAIGTSVQALARIESRLGRDVELASASQYWEASTPRCRILTDGHAARGATEACCLGGFVFFGQCYCEGDAVALVRLRPRGYGVWWARRSVIAGSGRRTCVRAGAAQ